MDSSMFGIIYVLLGNIIFHSISSFMREKECARATSRSFDEARCVNERRGLQEFLMRLGPDVTVVLS